MDLSESLTVIAGFVGKIWSLPNTVLGIAIGLLGYALGKLLHWLSGRQESPKIDFEHNAIQFHDNPLMFLGALTLGNCINYGAKSPVNTCASHEFQHTIQAQWLGPAYIPLNVLGQAASLLTYPVASLRGPSPIHGKANFMESGPLSNPPRPWPWRSSDPAERC